MQKNKKKNVFKYKMDFMEKIYLSPIEKYIRFSKSLFFLFHLVPNFIDFLKI